MSNFRERIAKKLRDKEYRHNFFSGRLMDEIALSIRDLREQRKMTQDELAIATGMRQGTISRTEQATYGRWGIPTLLRLAKGLDARLIVALVPMEKIIAAYETEPHTTGNNQEIPSDFILSIKIQSTASNDQTFPLSESYDGRS
ncbi:MAG: helix-turn-helix domain-containing protein [Leptospirillum sp.]